MRHGSQVHEQKKEKGTDVGLIMMWPSFQWRIIHARVERRIVASSVVSLSVSIQKPDGVFHVVHLSIHPAAALNTQMVWVQTEDNGSEFYAHVLSNCPRLAHVLSKTSVAKRYDTGGMSTSKYL